MELHGTPWNSINIPWNSMELHGHSTEFHETSMEFHGGSMELHGIPWTSMEFHRILWNSMEFHGIPWGYFTRGTSSVLFVLKKVRHVGIRPQAFSKDWNNSAIKKP